MTTTLSLIFVVVRAADERHAKHAEDRQQESHSRDGIVRARLEALVIAENNGLIIGCLLSSPCPSPHPRPLPWGEGGTRGNDGLIHGYLLPSHFGRGWGEERSDRAPPRGRHRLPLSRGEGWGEGKDNHCFFPVPGSAIFRCISASISNGVTEAMAD